MIKVYTAENIIDAQLVCDRLLNDGIAAEVHGGYLSGAIGELPVGAIISIWIRDPLYKLRALELLRAYESECHEALGTCHCDNCGELVEGNYALCWKCSTPLPEPLKCEIPPAR